VRRAQSEVRRCAGEQAITGWYFFDPDAHRRETGRGPQPEAEQEWSTCGVDCIYQGA
jgi:hypothetical protein